MCALSRGTLWKYVKSGELKASLTPGGHYRISREDLEAFMRQKGMYPLGRYKPSRRKVLIVDDDPQVQKVLSGLLAAHGYETETASQGFEAGVKIMSFRPEVVVLDLVMPGMDGFEVCRRIKENPETSHIKVLALTGYHTEENRKRILEAGADGYMVKPPHGGTLLRQVTELMEMARRGRTSVSPPGDRKEQRTSSSPGISAQGGVEPLEAGSRK